IPETKSDDWPFLHAWSRRSVLRRETCLAGAYSAGTNAEDTTLFPVSRIRARSSVVSFVLRGECETQSASRVRLASGSVVAITPVSGRPHSDPASRPDLAGS